MTDPDREWALSALEKLRMTAPEAIRYLTALRNLCPKPGSSITSITISVKSRQADLSASQPKIDAPPFTAETRAKLNRLIKAIKRL